MHIFDISCDVVDKSSFQLPYNWNYIGKVINKFI